MEFIWKTIVLVMASLLLLRISGRKSISQLTIPTTVIMISIGTIIVQPIIEKSITKTIAIITLLILVLVLVELLQLKLNLFEKLFTGKSIIVIKNGALQTKNLKKLRITSDKLEMQLREKGISNIEDIKNATIEPNGQLGYELMPDAKPLTVGEFKKLMSAFINQQSSTPSVDGSLFHEVINKKHKTPHNDKLK
ncbi:DUF421 domain-containing protein [Litchfieldia salsa]|uniref:Uncharacterized membrane protein YcaP, DUF421 family n=1 Tax=Litchfieldia salsa TaxID=930152 RepID=A0A1H0VKW9_9BACI|nr:YetF domain-containing protein [Litchfieldia salsa]SDP79003.1 Uncharacterized membrane protein YcaP, DUF421 family [Litchfieldia salsa]